MTQGGSILVVDDELESLKLLTTLLVAEGYQVRPADSGELALASAAAKPPDLILLDVSMPSIDGLEACRRLKAEPRSRSIPVIFLSAAGEIEQRAEGLRLGADDFISKPFRREELLARVETHLELARLRTQLEEEAVKRTTGLRLANEELQLDLVSRRRAESALHENDEHFGYIADNAPVMIWVHGPDKAQTFYNKQVSTFTGRPIDDLIDQGCVPSIHPEDRDRYAALYLESRDTRQGFQIHYRMRRADGEYRWVMTTAAPRQFNATQAGFVGTIIDITDFQRPHEQRLKAEKLESVGVLSAGIAHDFNNLLGAIFGETDLALSELPEDSAARENVERITAIAVRASEIVHLLMAYAGDHNQERAVVHLSAVVTEMLRLLKSSISRKTVLKTDLCPDVPPVLANPTQIRQVIMNLISNAAEAIEDGEGAITVSTCYIRVDPESAANPPGNLPPGDYIRLAVEDTGCGMTEEAHAKVFDPFYTTKFLGRGLGLAVVQGIVRSHSGTIHVVSTPGKGSTFEIVLPCIEKRFAQIADPSGLDGEERLVRVVHR
jgi:PAS domain S-box-containing protein